MMTVSPRTLLALSLWTIACGPAPADERAAAKPAPVVTPPTKTASEPAAEPVPAVATTPAGVVDVPGFGGLVRTQQDGPWTRRSVIADASGVVRTERDPVPGDALDGASGGVEGGSLGGAPAPGGGPETGRKASVKRGQGTGGPRAEAGPQPLKASRADDNADYRGYLKFLATWTSRPEVRGEFQPIDVRDRGFVRVLDGDGRPVPGARLFMIDPKGERPAWQWEARTYGDGRAPFYPHLFGESGAPKQLEVTASADGESKQVQWDGDGELTVRLTQPRAERPLTLEVLFLIDTTGSMGDEIDAIKASLLSLTGKVKQRRADLTLRYGAVLYRDTGDDYLTMAHPFTDDVAAFDAALQTVTASGGGDIPEALNQGLDRAVEGMQWQDDAARLVFLVCDAPPKMRVKGDVPYGDSAARALARGLKIHAIAASGLDPLGTLVLRQIAHLTRGQFIFIEYGDSKQSAAQHGVTGPAEAGNNLDDILLAQITAEVDGWGR